MTQVTLHDYPDKRKDLRAFIKRAHGRSMPTQAIIESLQQKGWPVKFIIEAMYGDARRKRWYYAFAGILVGMALIVAIIAFGVITCVPVNQA